MKTKESFTEQFFKNLANHPGKQFGHKKAAQNRPQVPRFSLGLHFSQLFGHTK